VPWSRRRVLVIAFVVAESTPRGGDVGTDPTQSRALGETPPIRRIRTVAFGEAVHDRCPRPIVEGGMDGVREQRLDGWRVRDPEPSVLDRLLRQAYLFDDPAAYEAGVRDALAALAAGEGWAAA
jgi:hypothetical protein